MATFYVVMPFGPGVSTAQDGGSVNRATAFAWAAGSGAPVSGDPSPSDPPPPAPVITAPADGALLASSNVTVAGTATPSLEVTVTFSSGAPAIVFADGAGGWQVGRVLPDGSHTVRATAKDGLGSISPQSAPVTFTVDTRAPSRPTIGAPVNGGHLNTTNVTISGASEPGSTVLVFEGAQIATATTAGNGVWSTSATFSAGSHSISARARDAAGNLSSLSLTTTFTVDLTPPASPVIIGPSEGAVLHPDQVVVSGTAEPFATVLLYRGGVVVTNTAAGHDGYWSQRLTVGGGTVGVRAQARDLAGNSSPLSDERTFTVDATPPTVRFNTQDGVIITQFETQRINGSAEDDNGVARVTLDFYDIAGRGIASSQATCFGCPGTPVTWEAGSTPLIGRYVVRAYATDVVGNRSAEASITVIFVRVTP